MEFLTTATRVSYTPSPQSDRWIHSLYFIKNTPTKTSDAQPDVSSCSPVERIVHSSSNRLNEYPSLRPAEPATTALFLLQAAIKLVVFGRSVARIRKGVQPGTIASDTQTRPASACVELAIATSRGLRSFIRDPPPGFVSTEKLDSTFNSMDEGSSDSSCWSSGPNKGKSKGFRYKNMKCDVFTVLDRLRNIGFHERLPLNPPCSTPSLLDQISDYLARPPDNTSGTQIRWLFLSGHNSTEHSRFIIDAKRCFRWPELRHALKKTPQGVVVVLVLCCCRAEEAASELVENLCVLNLVVLASCARGESSKASGGGGKCFQNGDKFLNALFKALKPRNFEGAVDTWDQALNIVAHKLWEKTTNQHPVIYLKTELLPSRILPTLMSARKPSICGRGRTLSISVVHSSFGENSGRSIF